MTIGYPEQRPLDLLTIFSGTRPPCQVTVHYRHFRADEVPCDHDALLSWLYDRWAEKDRLLEQFHRTGNFPAASPIDPPPARLLALSDARCILLNTFLAVSTWFAIRVICAVVCLLVDFVLG